MNICAKPSFRHLCAPKERLGYDYTIYLELPQSAFYRSAARKTYFGVTALYLSLRMFL